MKKICILLIIALLLACSSCSPNEQKKASVDFFAMDTYMTVTAYGDNAQSAVDAAKKRVEQLDKILNAEDKNSEIYKLNKSGKSKLSEESFKLVKSALRYNKLTGGAFNPAMHNVSELWGFVSKDYRVPSVEELESALKIANTDNVLLSAPDNVELKNGTELDLGGIAKGYASSEVVRILRQNGVSSAVVNLGGNVQTLGKKPDGSSWNVAVKKPEGDGYLATLRVSDKAVVTSGGYERYFERDGKVYHHILNPDTGSPASSGLKSVTVVCDDGTFADAMSTALFIMGEKKAEKFRGQSDIPFDYLLLTDDDRLIVTSGISDSVQSDCEMTVI